MKIAVVGATGFVGSAFETFLATKGHDVTGVGRANYDDAKGAGYDLVINASNNSKKYISDREPLTDFDLSVTQQMRVLADFPTPVHVLLSSVDVYADLDSFDLTKEDVAADPARMSRYGFHKHLAEQCVRHYAPNWLIVRLAGMVGPGLKKNPVFDIVNGQPLRIHPDSEYQFMHTAEVARIAWTLIESGQRREVFNLCGDGLISPRQIAALAGSKMNLSELPTNAAPRNVRISNAKVATLSTLPTSEDAIKRYLSEIRP
ncbi:MAG: NAD(P)-dependent oxidoreductase [Armatimonadetes bacterium]|nr:NAD(P)-dependent oxidoreductase [Armatimonadota bacterium]